MEYGYRLYTGVIMLNSEVDYYNRLSLVINSYGENPPEHLLNGRHNFINSIALQNII